MSGEIIKRVVVGYLWVAKLEGEKKWDREMLFLLIICVVLVEPLNYANVLFC